MDYHYMVVATLDVGTTNRAAGGNMTTDLNIMIGGEAGQGVQSMGLILSKTFTRGAHHIFADQDYESRIRGGHSFCRVRVRESQVSALSEQVHLLIALNPETVALHNGEVSGDGLIISDGNVGAGPDGRSFSVPMTKLAEDEAGNKLMANSVMLGAAIGLIGYDLEILNAVIEGHFKDTVVADQNIKAAVAGYRHVKDNYRGSFKHQVKPLGKSDRIVLDGNEAVALGALAAGCKFVAAYPMTPTTSIFEYMASKQKDLDLVVVQPEDEISAINMIIGASYAGARAMTATSGGGFCLMAEGFGLAGMTETPIVVAYGQRPGPAIGLPTRMEQGDLQFILHASHGEFPRAIFAPGTIEEAFWLTVKAFNVAEKYQLPAVVLIDHYLADSYSTVNRFNFSDVVIDRGEILGTGELEKMPAYQRYKITNSGISPRAFPFTNKHLVAIDSDEHDENGHMVEDAETRSNQVAKRMRKHFSLKQDIAPPHVHGPKTAETTFIGWGSTYGPLKEAVDILHKGKVDCNLVHFSEVWPFDKEAAINAIDSAKFSYVVENNFTGQFAHLIAQETGKLVNGKILKWDGRPFSPGQIIREFNKVGCC
jgi:2-oxoglutarate/2-oxoacid ferredoxin oxidoreductase subunit alpha